MVAGDKKGADDRDAQVRPEEALLSRALRLLRASSGELPGDVQMRVDVQLCLMDAMTDIFPITRSEIELDTVPSGRRIGADGQGWGMCLADYAERISGLRDVYASYVHRPRYTQETLDEPFSAIVDYLREKLVAQVAGGSE